MEKYQEIERSIIKKFRKDIWSKFVKAVQEFELIKENDKIMVCISGGKDSFLNINLEIFESDIFDIVDQVDKSPCYLCARMRRGCLYSKAEELGCNKIALGHHFDDVIETTLLSMFYGAEIKTMMPKLHSDNFEGLELIRPMYLVKEESVISWAKYNSLNFINCACKFTSETFYDENNSSKRKEIKNLIKQMKKSNPNVDYNIYKALDNVNLNCTIGTKRNGEYESFLKYYDEIK